MRKFYSILIFILLTKTIFCQESDSTNTVAVDTSLVAINDSVNVRDILAKEIEAIKTKQLEEDKKLQTLVVTQEAEQDSGLSLLEYSFILIEAVLVITIGVFWLKRKSSKKKVELKKLKFNISKLREEKIICSLTNDLTSVRRQLQTIPINYNDGGKDVIRKARQYEISKGEVFLAAKIKLLSGESK